MSDGSEVARQRRFYETAQHEHLRVQEDDAYASKVAARLAQGTGMRRDHRVLEVGAGFGRFTFPLLRHCGELVALDLSQRVLDSLDETRAQRGIAANCCQTVCADLDDPDSELPEGPFDAVVGFFLLHHLPNFPYAIRRLAPLLRPDGRMGFIEPNRRNPLFLAQVAACADMTWQEEKGMFRLSARQVEHAFESAALSALPTRRFGFFPPQILNHVPGSAAFESALERVPGLEWILPLLLTSAEAPGDQR